MEEATVYSRTRFWRRTASISSRSQPRVATGEAKELVLLRVGSAMMFGLVFRRTAMNVDVSSEIIINAPGWRHANRKDLRLLKKILEGRR